MDVLLKITDYLPTWAMVTIFAGVWVIVTAWINLLIKRRYKASAETGDARGIALSAFMRISYLFLLTVGLVIIYNFFSLPLSADNLIKLCIILLLVTAVTLFLDRILIGLTDSYLRDRELYNRGGSFIKGGIHVIVVSLGLLVIFDTLGISITPLLASLGVGSIAVGLALQGTLSNFFGGVSILVDNPIKVGDFIKLENGEEGFVEEVGWRSTKIRVLPNNILIVPNAKLVESIIINFAMPAPAMNVFVYAGVHYSSDLEKVERVTLEVAKEVLEAVEGGKQEVAPVFQYREFSDSSINFRIIMQVRSFLARHDLTHQFIKRLKTRFDREGIVIPFPMRTLTFEKGKGDTETVKLPIP